jgi:hypothetical protein
LTDNTAGQNSIRLLRLISSNDPRWKIREQKSFGDKGD